MKGCVVVGGARVTAQAIERARKVGVAAIIAGGIDDADLEAVLGYDLGVAITGSERIGLTVVITEGFGEIAMARADVRRCSRRAKATMRRSTARRRSARASCGPRSSFPLRAGQHGGDVATPEMGRLEIGAPVRVIRDPYFGLIGPCHGASARAADARNRARRRGCSK